MKRILAITLTLVMLLAVLAGCMASQNPSGNEGEQNPSGKRLPITMTIAETLPSCVAFEYKDEKPYCFYAYDTEGKLYRVLWTDFTGLNEKDVVIVDYNDAIKTLTYDEYPEGGWTPQYEVTAISVKKENTADENLVSHIQIKSGDNTIRPFGSLLWSKTDNGDGTFTELNASMLDTAEIINLYTNIIPKLVLDESVSYLVQANGSVENVYLFTPNGDMYTKSVTTFDALSNLADGTYYVALNVLLSGNCDPDAPQNSYRYEDVFCLIVGEEENLNDDLTHSGYEVEVKLLQYTWDGWGISTKTVGACDVAYNIIDALKAMKETGETVPKISDEVFEIGGGQYSAERGTMWIESSGKIYRLTPDLSQICLVETHFGEGKVLEITDEFKTNVNNAWHYAPYDYYKGTYNKGDYTVDLTSVFKSGSSIKLNIKKIQIESGYDPNNTITVELISSVDQEVNIKLRCQQSDDNLAAGDYRTVQLKKGEPTTVDLTFGGWPNFTYWVYIEADFTKAEITINP